MSSSSLMTMDHHAGVSSLLNRFIRMTVRADEQDRKYKRKHATSQSQQKRPQQQQQQQQMSTSLSSAMKRNQKLFVQSNNGPSKRTSKQVSSVNKFNVSPVTNDYLSLTQTEFDDEEQRSFSHNQVRFWVRGFQLVDDKSSTIRTREEKRFFFNFIRQNDEKRTEEKIDSAHRKDQASDDETMNVPLSISRSL